MIQRISRVLGLPAILLAVVLLLSRPQAAAQGFADGVALCLHSVLPALFPFFVVSSLLTAVPGSGVLAAGLRPLTRRAGLTCSDAPLILLLSWLGGYAAAARLIGDRLRSGRLSRREAELLMALGCCSSPGFVVGCVGGLMLDSLPLGILLYGLQLAANCLAAGALCLIPPSVPASKDRGGGEDKALPEPSAALSLSDAISGAVDSSLAVCGCVLFFRVIAAVLEDLVLLSPPSRALLRGGLEITAGCGAFAALGGRYALQGVCLCLSLLGASVFSQLRALAGSRLPLGRFALSRLIHAAVLQLLTALCSRALPGQAAVFRSLQDRVILTSRLAPDCAFLLLCFLGAVLYKLGRKFYNTIQ